MFNNKRKEIAGMFILISLFIAFLHKILITNERMFSHDTIWFYGIFHYFAESIQNGFFPFWDPYNYCGQTFYNHIFIMDILNPITVILSLINKFFNFSLVSLYHWNTVLKIIFINLGIYLCFREVNKYRISSFITFLVFLFSSFTFASFRQAGLINALSWFPWALWFLIRLLKKIDLFNIVCFSFFLGLCFSGYQVIFGLVYLMLFLCTVLINRRRFFSDFFSSKKNLSLILISFLIILSMSLKLLLIFVERDNFIPMARQKTSPNGQLTFDDKSGGNPSEPFDFLGLVNPKLAASGYFEEGRKHLSEAFLYIGFIPLFLSIVGLLFSKQGYRLNFTILLFSMVFLMLGERTGFNNLKNLIFPFLKYVRHMQIFAGFFLFTLMYFVGQGCDIVLDFLRKKRPGKLIICVLSLIISIDIILYSNNAYRHVTIERKNIKFNEHGEKFYKLQNRRVKRIVTSDYIRYYRPNLYSLASAMNSCTIPEVFSKNIKSGNLYELYSIVKDNDVILFNTKALNSNVRDFIDFCIRNFRLLKKEEKDIFIDILYVVYIDISRNSQFYKSFIGSNSSTLLFKNMIAYYLNEVQQGKDSDLDFQKKEGLFLSSLDFFNLESFKIDKEALARSFDWLQKKVSFKERVNIHNLFFKVISVKEYLRYIWASSHSEEFTVLQHKQYRELLHLLKDDTLIPEPINLTLLKMMGIKDEIIKFFPKAMVLDRPGIKQRFLSNSEEYLLYIESTLGNGLHSDAKAQDSFSYGVIRYNPNLLELEVDSWNEGYLYYSDGYDSHWKAYIDGVKTEIFRANMAFKAIRIPKGHYKIKFIYFPESFATSLLLYFLSIVFCCTYLTFYQVNIAKRR